jgi:hypothetical protein
MIELTAPSRRLVWFKQLRVPEIMDTADDVSQIFRDTKRLRPSELSGAVFHHIVPEMEERVGLGRRKRVTGYGTLETANKRFGKSG